MTGQGAAQARQDDLFVSAEIRTVNSRYYKLTLRTTEGYTAIEPKVDELVRRHVRRGTVQMDVRVTRQSKLDDVGINRELLSSYVRQLKSIATSLDLDQEIDLGGLLALPGVVDEGSRTSLDLSEVWPTVRTAVNEALEGLRKMRAGEGQAMAKDLAENCQSIREQLTTVEARAPLVVQQYRGRITDRVNKLLAEFEVHVEPTDVIREVALFAERSDIAEEVVRLRSHLDQFHDIMQLEESSGRKLEFVTQEMFREVNTIGSKSNDAEIAKSVVEIKAAVERIREMIQNIE